MPIVKLLPGLFQALFSLVVLLMASRTKYVWKKTIIYTSIFYIILMIINVFIFYEKGLLEFEKYALFSVFIPEAIFITLISKRRILSSIVASLSAYLAVYAIQLIKTVFVGTFEIYFFDYLHFFAFPFVALFLRKIYVPLHDDIEKLQPKLIWWLLVFTLILFAEFFVYGTLIGVTNEYVLRLEIFCVATTSIYYVAIAVLFFILREYKTILIENSDYLMLQNTISSFDEILKIREHKEEQLRILRHDLKHVLITVSSLIKKEKYQEATDFISEHVKNVDSTRVKRHSTVPLLDAIIEYYHIICKENNIKFTCKINNVEDALKVNLYEIVIFISNCLENAITATNKLTENKYIKFIFLNNDGRLVLQIENSFNGEITYDTSNNPTSFEKGHGFGTNSNKWFAKRNKLSLNYKITNNTFTINVLFKESN